MTFPAPNPKVLSQSFQNHVQICHSNTVLMVPASLLVGVTTAPMNHQDLGRRGFTLHTLPQRCSEDEGIFLIEAPASQMTLVCIKLMLELSGPPSQKGSTPFSASMAASPSLLHLQFHSLPEYPETLFLCRTVTCNHISKVSSAGYSGIYRVWGLGPGLFENTIQPTTWQSGSRYSVGT